MIEIIGKGDHRERRIAAVGMFDGVHAGHRHLLDALKQRAAETGLSPVVVTFGNHPRSHIFPGRAPQLLSSPAERLALIEAEGIPEAILLKFDNNLRQLTAKEFLEKLRDDYNVKAIVLGYNNHFGHDHPNDAASYTPLGESVGVTVFHAEEFRHSGGKVSSSTIRNLLAEGDITHANRLLGYAYTICGRVVHGKELGRTIGFPTANIEPDNPDMLIPANGVYAVSVTVPDGTTYPGMMNIGHRPTVDTPNSPASMEVHIIGYTGDLYGKSVTVKFLEFMRHERRFPSLDALRQQLTEDARQATSVMAMIRP